MSLTFMFSAMALITFSVLVSLLGITLVENMQRKPKVKTADKPDSVDVELLEADLRRMNQALKERLHWLAKRVEGLEAYLKLEHLPAPDHVIYAKKTRK